MEGDRRTQPLPHGSRARSWPSRGHVPEAGTGPQGRGGAASRHHRPGGGARRRQARVHRLPERYRPLALDERPHREAAWHTWHWSQLEHRLKTRCPRSSLMRPEVAMQRVPQLPVVIGFLIAVPGFLAAQGSPSDSSTVQGAAATLRSDLRNFVTAQEAHFADHGPYARSLRQMQHGYHASPGVTLVLLTSSDSSHSEIAISDKVPGLVCAMFVGNTPPPLGTGKEAVPSCRGP